MLIFILCITLLGKYDCLKLSLNTKADPEINMNTEEVIKHYQYPFEKHEVTTEDGYILTVYRIPRGLKPSTISPRPAVLLQHGLLDSSFTWVNNGPQKSLAFILADKGFDVWLGNVRGNSYSRSHKKYSTWSRNFWDFTWNEMAKYDLPAMVDYILSVSKVNKIGYVGHSQGTEIGFAQFSENPDMNKNVSAFVALAPVTYLGNAKTAIVYLATLGDSLNLLMNTIGTGEFLPSNQLISAMSAFVCGDQIASVVCGNVAFLLQGFNVDNLNYSRMSIYSSHVPAGTSSKNIAHYAQSYLSNEFQMYDYGFMMNMIKYKQRSPPKYILENIKMPIAMFWGGNDWLAVPKDVEKGMSRLGENVKLKKYIPEYNHIDFVWGKDANVRVYPDIAEFLLKYAK